MVVKIAITGASGVLGSAVRRAFEKAEGAYNLLCLSFTQSGDGLTRLDLNDRSAALSAFEAFRPDWVIHCAAERRPDVAEKNPEAAKKLNSEVPGFLAGLSKVLGFTLVYISTDYVFDGTAPPYKPSSQTHPLQFYGQSKRDGELAVLGVDGAKSVVLRVPVLYGPCRRNSDTAVNILLDVVQDQSGKKYKMDHHASRYPTNVDDISKFLVRLTTMPEPLPPIMHFSAQEKFTKYEICQILANATGLPIHHIVPETEPPVGATPRPKDTHLDISETEKLLPDGDLGCCTFTDWWKTYLNLNPQSQ
ncbi:NAD(P)-binding protein [Fistulina hepatica ATCC 64428]|uniref:NAD(P)-binding protein n=1 Tax=Fistulina hepatica ATCC 64428 TaxID=1128425 RepID=A0A0D7A8R7_9AGAR|nr:NAD(P)-binding protein [Fistulina hepatica ATCC 64428]